MKNIKYYETLAEYNADTSGAAIKPRVCVINETGEVIFEDEEPETTE